MVEEVRYTASTITDDALDELYEQLEWLRSELSQEGNDE